MDKMYAPSAGDVDAGGKYSRDLSGGGCCLIKDPRSSLNRFPNPPPRLEGRGGDIGVARPLTILARMGPDEADVEAAAALDGGAGGGARPLSVLLALCECKLSI